MAHAPRPHPLRLRYVHMLVQLLDIYYCTSTYPPCGTCQFPIIYNVATCNVSSYYRAPLEMETIIITEGVGSVFGRWRRRDAITQTQAETDHHSRVKSKCYDSSKERKCL